MTELKFKEGDEVEALVTDRDSRIYAGEKYIVEFAYDDVPEFGEPFYSLKNAEALESQLKLSRTWREMLARKLPTPLDIIKAVPISGWGWNSGLGIDESDIRGETDTVELYGKTDEGLPFGLRMQVVAIWQTDE